MQILVTEKCNKIKHLALMHICMSNGRSYAYMHSSLSSIFS